MKTIGSKFNPDGTVRRFPGSSLVSPVDAAAAQFEQLTAVQQRCRETSFARRLRFLPPQSFHMTVFDLLCDQVRAAERWSDRLPLDCPLEEADASIARWLAAVPPCPGPLRMTFAGLGPLDTTLLALLEPADPTTRRALERYRAQVARVTGIRHPSFSRYRFHVSLAYRLHPLTGQEERDFASFARQVNLELDDSFGVLEVEPPQLVLFDDMFEFPTSRKTGGAA